MQEPVFTELDYTYAGNRQWIDTSTPVVNIKTFGAKGDGITDDTDAFDRSLQTVNGILYVPAGKYMITRMIRRDSTASFVLRGDGIDKTIIHFPKSLKQISGSDVSFGPYLMTLNGNVKGTKVGELTQPAKKGDRVLHGRFQNVVAGDWIRIVLENTPSYDLFDLIYNGRKDLIPTSTEFDQSRFFINNKVKRIEDGKIILIRPLYIDVPMVLRPSVEKIRAREGIIGVEHMSFTAPHTPYRGHFKEEGFNALCLSSVWNGWVHDVTFKNMDTALSFNNGTSFSRVSDVTFESDNNRSGHHGIWIKGNSDDNIITGFDFRMSYVHDISIEYFASMNVFERGKGVNINLDHHKVAPYGNLFTEIHLGKGARWFSSGGKKTRGGQGSRSVFWKLYTNTCSSDKCTLLPVPPSKWGNNLTLVGAFKPVTQQGFTVLSYPNNDFTPDNLYRAQLAKRVKELISPVEA